ncbi:MAG: hypothetical protein R8M70_02225 [Alphaproteobacteria bacterium]|nr:hypothetical protein [Alphaproteobacteria bacterium]
MRFDISKILIFCIIPSVALGDIGAEKRKYVDWNSAPYNNYVRICSDAGCATGQFISAAHVLTSKQAAGCCGVKNKPACVVYTSDGQTIKARLVQAGGGLANCAGATNETSTDWGVLALDSRKTILDRLKNEKFGFQQSANASTQGNLKRAGFGDLKVLTSSDIQAIKSAYSQWLKKVYPYDWIDRGKTEKKGADLGLGKYDIYENNGAQYKTFLDEFTKLTGKNFLTEYLGDGSRLKLVENCKITKTSGVNLTHNCSAWSGDGGSALLNSNNQIVGMATHSENVIAGAGDMNSGISVGGVFSAVKKLFEKPVAAERRPDPNPTNDTIYRHVNGDVFMRKDGSAAWRNNNMGNVEYTVADNRVIGRSGPKGKYSRGGRFAVFASEQDGHDALRDMLRRVYNDKTIMQTMAKYAPSSDSNNPNTYAIAIAKELGKPVTTLLSSLTDDQLEVMIKQIRKKEGWIKGYIINCKEQPSRCK